MPSRYPDLAARKLKRGQIKFIVVLRWIRFDDGAGIATPKLWQINLRQSILQVPFGNNFSVVEYQQVIA